MAKSAGRFAILYKNAVPIAGVRVSTIKGSADPIDITDKDSLGLTEYLSSVATQQITLSVEGVYSTPILRDIFFDTAASKLLTDVTFRFADALAAKDTIGGNFFFGSYEEANPHDAETTYTAEFMSSGAWTHN